VWHEFHVLAANVYDSLFGAATDKLDVNVEEWNTTAVPAEHTAGYPVVTVKDGTGTGEIDTNGGAIMSVTTVATTTNLTNLPTIPANWLTAAGLAGDAVTEIQSGLATQASVDIIDDFLDTEVAAIKAKTDLIPASPAAVGSAMTLTSGERDSIAAALLDLANGVETGITVRQVQRALLAMLAGVVTGAGSGTEVFKNPGGGTTRVTVTVDGSGNRSAITLNV
jgi:hypothetical protein